MGGLGLKLINIQKGEEMTNLIIQFRDDSIVTIEELTQASKIWEFLASTNCTVDCFDIDILELRQAIEIHETLTSKGYEVEIWRNDLDDDGDFLFFVIREGRFCSYREINSLPNRLSKPFVSFN